MSIRNRVRKLEAMGLAAVKPIIRRSPVGAPEEERVGEMTVANWQAKFCGEADGVKQ